MSKKKNRQSGFSLTVIVVSLAVVLLVAGVGFVVLKHQRNDNNAMTSNNNPAPAPASPTDSPTATPATPLPPAENTLQVKTIPELGLKISVPTSLSDLTYNVGTIQLSNGKTAKSVSFSTSTLTKADPKCSAKAGPLGAYVIGEGQYPKDDENVGTDYGLLVKQFNGSFVTYTAPQGSCTADPDATKISSDAKAAFGSIKQTVDLSN